MFLWGADDLKKKVNWVVCELVTKPKKAGGLGVGSLDSVGSSCQMMVEIKIGDNSFQSTCIKSIHKLKLIDDKPIVKNSIKGVWLSISQIDVDLQDKGIFLSDLFKRVVGNGCGTFFWKDSWCSNIPLKDLFPNLYVLETSKDCLILDKRSFDSEAGSRWIWRWSKQLWRGREADQLSDLMSLIDNFQFVGGPDR